MERHVDVAILGAGTAGMAAWRTANEHTRSVVLVEGGPYGTTCARVGCMPSKLLIAAAEAAHAAHHAAGFGVHVEGVRVDGGEVMRRVRDERDRFVGFVVDTVEAWDPERRLRGRARFLDDHRLVVTHEGGATTALVADRVVIATGSRATFPGPWRELGDRLLVSDDLFSWTDLPDSVAVFGVGVIGLELAQSLHRLGVRVRLFGLGGQVGPLTDPVVRAVACAAFQAELPVHPDARVTRVAREDDEVVVTYTDPSAGVTVPVTERFQFLLAATGRRPNVDDLGLDQTSLPLDAKGVPRFDPTTGQVGRSHVFVAGDASNDRPLLHEAADLGRVAGDNAGRYPDVRRRPRRTPLGVVFSDPQLALVGATWQQLTTEGVAFAAGAQSFEDQGRSRVMRKNRGILRIYGDPHTGRLLGAEMAGPAAEHIGHLLAWAVQQHLTVQEALDMPFFHPVIEEGVRSALRHLRRELSLGPAPVERCLDCGPGA